MNRNVDRSNIFVLGCGLALSLFLPLAAADAQVTTLYQFTGGNDGGNPPCGLISGGKGLMPGKARFYGTTQIGGTSGYGTVFQVGNTGFESPLYSFTGGSDGAYPRASLITDTSGNLYGTTAEGGASGYGVVFKLTSGGTETVLHSFTGGSDGAYPVASLIADGSGNLYGTTADGGSGGLGTVFEVTSGGSESVLHSFGGSDGAFPAASLVMDADGNLYGTTNEGGTSTNCDGGCGTIFRLAPGGSETVLYSFTGSDGAFPEAALIMAKNGNMYGTTEGGGASEDGTVFEYSHKGKFTTLHSFSGGSDGAFPVSPVVKKSGFLYGTTYGGGTSSEGTVFKTPARPGGSDTVLYSFTGGSEGGLPEGGLLYEGGKFFGTAFGGGDSGCTDGEGCGTVFDIAP